MTTKVKGKAFHEGMKVSHPALLMMGRRFPLSPAPAESFYYSRAMHVAGAIAPKNVPNRECIHEAVKKIAIMSLLQKVCRELCKVYLLQ